MPHKSEMVVVRIEPAQARKLQALALASGNGLNKSAAIRHLVDRAPEPSDAEITSALHERIRGNSEGTGPLAKVIPAPSIDHSAR